MNSASQLRKEEKQAKKKLSAALLVLLLVRKPSRVNTAFIGAVYDTTVDTLDVEPTKEDAKLLHLAAAGLATRLVASILYQQMEDEDLRYAEAAESAVGNAQGKIGQIVATELFREHNDRVAERSAWVEWNAVLDSRTCEECRDLHGEIFKVEELKDTPPLHVSCRCILEWVDSPEAD